MEMVKMINNSHTTFHVLFPLYVCTMLKTAMPQKGEADLLYRHREGHPPGIQLDWDVSKKQAY